MTTQNSGLTCPLFPGFVNVQSGTLMSSGAIAQTSDGIQCEYTYGVNNITPVATPTDFIVIQGSATKTVRIRSISMGGAATAAGGGAFQVQVVRRLSTGGTIGSAVLTAVTPGYADINNAAPTAVVSYVQTANYTTVQTASGVLASGRMGLIALTSAAIYAPFTFAPPKAILLRGTSDYVCVNLGAGAVPSGGVLDFSIVLEEDNS